MMYIVVSLLKEIKREKIVYRFLTGTFITEHDYRRTKYEAGEHASYVTSGMTSSVQLR